MIAVKARTINCEPLYDCIAPEAPPEVLCAGAHEEVACKAVVCRVKPNTFRFIIQGMNRDALPPLK